MEDVFRNTLSDYVSGPEEPEQAPPSPDYVLEPDPEADPEEDDDEDPEEDPIDYPADGGDNGDDEMDIEEDEEDWIIRCDEEDEYFVPSAEETVQFETDEFVAKQHRIYLPTSSTTISMVLHHHPRFLFPLSPPSTCIDSTPPSPIRSLGYRAATIRMRAEAAATSLSLPLPPPFILSPTRSDTIVGEDRPEVNLPPRMGLGIALGPGYEVGESSAAAAARPAGGFRADYGFVATMDREIRRDPEKICWDRGSRFHGDEIVESFTGSSVSTIPRLGATHERVFESIDRRTHAHTRQLMETEAGMSREAWGRAMDASDLAHGEVISLRTTVHAQMSEITELQSADHRRQRAISDLLETDRRRREEMRELRAADRTRQQQIIQTLTVMQTLQREMTPLQGLVTTLQGQVTALQGQVMTLQGQVTALQGQQGPAGGPAQPELPEEAGSSS
ncbi:hypothetical protein Tco_0413834 [Tanacetum coccineum]